MGTNPLCCTRRQSGDAQLLQAGLPGLGAAVGHGNLESNFPGTWVSRGPSGVPAAAPCGCVSWVVRNLMQRFGLAPPVQGYSPLSKHSAESPCPISLSLRFTNEDAGFSLPMFLRHSINQVP